MILPASSACQAIVGLSAMVIAMLMSGCVKQSDYEVLQKENQQLQMRLDQANAQVRQIQAELNVQQVRVLQLMEVHTKLQKSQEQLQQTQDELEALKTEFEKFRVQRRSAMLRKKIPVLNLDGGKVLRDAVITAIKGDELSIQHQDGFIKVALAASSDDLRWEACYDPREAKLTAREKLLAEARLIELRRGREQSQSAKTEIVSSASPSSFTRGAIETLRQQLAAQRSRLNTEFQALAAKNSAALHGAEWNSTTPEASPLLNSLSGSRAVLGLSRLHSLRDAINQTLQQLRSLDPTAR
jgi:exonuclease VII large subunit